MRRKSFAMIMLVMLCILMVSCGRDAVSEQVAEATETASLKSDQYIVVGFSQLGAESDWRSANTESMKETFTTENGYKLILEDGQQKQVNQELLPSVVLSSRTWIILY